MSPRASLAKAESTTPSTGTRAMARVRLGRMAVGYGHGIVPHYALRRNFPGRWCSVAFVRHDTRATPRHRGGAVRGVHGVAPPAVLRRVPSWRTRPRRAA